MTDHHSLYKAAKRIAEILDDGPYSVVAKLENMPASRSAAINSFVISKSGYSVKMTDDEHALAKRVFDEMRWQERVRGEQERRDGLMKLSEELEAMRAVLPAMAASLSIEMGVKARELAARAAIEGEKG